MRIEWVSAGRIFYVIGASGAGKDSLIAYARRVLNGDEGVLFAHRYITRLLDGNSENFIALSTAEFAAGGIAETRMRR